jgi:hypothetical protein
MMLTTAFQEATKTGLACAHKHMRADARTIMLLYTDAPPHTAATKGENRVSERMKLNKGSSYGWPDAPKFVDWVSGCNEIREGEKRARVYSIIQSHLADTVAPYTYLCTRTGGTCFQIEYADAALISKLTLGILLAWMGVEKEGAKTNAGEVAEVVQYVNTKTIDDIKSEEDKQSEIYWVREDKPPIVKLVTDNLRKTKVSVDSLKQYIRTRRTPMTDFSQRYRADAEYQKLVVENLTDIIESDVAAITVNPVFGSLWRTVCNDRLNEARDGLIALFGKKVDGIGNADAKARMKTWLEESYDYEAEILEVIQSVSAEDEFPCVLLDPTLDFKPTAAEVAEDEDDDTAENPSKFTRAELLEIGRSCDYRILRRLGKLIVNASPLNPKTVLTMQGEF